MSNKYFFAMKVKHGYWICYIDVVIVFLYKFLNGVFYINQFHLFLTEPNKVYKLIKAFWKLKQVPHVWYKTLIEFLEKQRLT